MASKADRALAREWLPTLQIECKQHSCDISDCPGVPERTTTLIADVRERQHRATAEACVLLCNMAGELGQAASDCASLRDSAAPGGYTGDAHD